VVIIEQDGATRNTVISYKVLTGFLASYVNDKDCTRTTVLLSLCEPLQRL